MALKILGLLVVLAVAVGLGAAARALAGPAGSIGFVIAALTGAVVSTMLGGGALGTIVALGAVVLGQLSLRKKEGFDAVNRAVVAFSSRGGTRFRGADLRGARFDDAELRACDFRGAKLDEGATERAKTIKLCIFDPPRAPAAAT